MLSAHLRTDHADGHVLLPLLLLLNASPRHHHLGHLLLLLLRRRKPWRMSLGRSEPDHARSASSAAGQHRLRRSHRPRAEGTVEASGISLGVLRERSAHLLLAHSSRRRDGRKDVVRRWHWTCRAAHLPGSRSRSHGRVLHHGRRGRHGPTSSHLLDPLDRAGGRLWCRHHPSSAHRAGTGLRHSSSPRTLGRPHDRDLRTGRTRRSHLLLHRLLTDYHDVTLNLLAHRPPLLLLLLLLHESHLALHMRVLALLLDLLLIHHAHHLVRMAHVLLLLLLHRLLRPHLLRAHVPRRQDGMRRLRSAGPTSHYHHPSSWTHLLLRVLLDVASKPDKVALLTNTGHRGRGLHLTGDSFGSFLLLVAIILDEHVVLSALAPHLIQSLLETLLLGCDSLQVVRVRVVQFLAVFAKLSLAAIERLSLLAQFAHLRLVVRLMLSDL